MDSSKHRHALSTTSKSHRAITLEDTARLTRHLAGWLRNERTEVVFESPLYNRADIAAVDVHAGTFVEYEVKTSYYNMRDELEFVSTVLECRDAEASRYDRVKQLKFDGIPDDILDRLITRYCVNAEHSKYRKHEWYLDPSSSTSTRYKLRPVKFYFAVHGWLMSAAAKQLIGTPYGLVVVEPDIDHIRVVKEAYTLA